MAITSVEQNKAKRAGVGLRAYDPELAFDGFTLFAPMGGQQVHLIDMQGNVEHSWEMPYPPGLSGYLTSRGTLFYNGKIEQDTFLRKLPFGGGVVLEADWNGRVLWEVRQDDHHHDGILLRNGNVLLVCGTALPDALVPRIKGGRPGSEHEGQIHSDYLVEMTTEGKMVWEWRAWEHLDPEVDVIPFVEDDRLEWTHANAVIELSNDNLMVSFRNLSMVIEIDRATGEIVWKLGAPPLAGQHAPVELANGNILLFDNGPHRLDNSLPFSRVIEVDRSTKEIVWKYQEDPVEYFYSPRISNAQRLPNGNTLICEGVFGRLFEVTMEGQVVWEYVNPYFTGPRNRVFRAYRYSPAEIDRARTRSS
jgi:hypothetical protein